MLDSSKIFPKLVAICYSGRVTVGWRSAGINGNGSLRPLDCVAQRQAVCQITNCVSVHGK